MQNNIYTEMQKNQYENDAANWALDNRDPVVGSFDAHNQWDDYELLFKDISNTENKVMLDFGCGPGRNLVKYSDKFNRIDGVDIAENNLKNAIEYIKSNNLDMNKHKLFLNNGFDLKSITSGTYDVVMSTICMQHICVHEIRYNLLKEFYRVLLSGGIITIQMGYGTPSPASVSYYDNNYDAISTNRGCDTTIESTDQIKTDLEKIGFVDFNYTITSTGPGDCHPNWIFFSAIKK